MGGACCKPFPDETDNKSNTFKVVNIDEDGNGHYPGKIEITSEKLLLHQDKKEPLSWPIRSLRRYGVESNIFSFEVGRRCQTGEGIFAFQCEQAEQLFRLLQTNIQRSSNYLEPRTVIMSQGVGSPISYPHTPVSPPSSNVYNVDPIGIENKKFGSMMFENSIDSSSPVYINVPTNGNDEDPSSSQTVFVYLTENVGKQYPAPLVLSPSIDGTYVGENSLKNLQYITLEFDSETPSPVVKTPTIDDESSPKYTTIDLQRTWALSQSTKPNIENDIGCTRRTRHNSNLFGVYKLLGKQSCRKF